VAYGRQQDEVLLADDLGVDVLVVVLVQGRDGSRVADPEVGGVGVLLEGYPGEGNVSRDIVRQRQVLMAEVVVLCLECQDLSLVGCLIEEVLRVWAYLTSESGVADSGSVSCRTT
jgi:hypothetical protein